MRAAPPSAGRRASTLVGGSRSSRPLVKIPGGCIRRGLWGGGWEKEGGQHLTSHPTSQSVLKDNLDKQEAHLSGRQEKKEKLCLLTAAVGIIQRGVIEAFGDCTGGNWKTTTTNSFSV